MSVHNCTVRTCTQIDEEIYSQTDTDRGNVTGVLVKLVASCKDRKTKNKLQFKLFLQPHLQWCGLSFLKLYCVLQQLVKSRELLLQTAQEYAQMF